MNRTTIHRSIATAAGIGWTFVAVTASQAQDVELFVGDSAAAGRPNILFILDDSGSMGGEVLTQSDYDPTVTYPGGSCNANTGRVYWSTVGSPPNCSTSNYFSLSALACRRALDAFAVTNGGSFYGRLAQYDSDDQIRWEQISSSFPNRPVECEADLPSPELGWAGHGDGSDPLDVYPQDGDAGHPWTDDPDSPYRITWGSWPTDATYSLYSGNYLNWYYGPPTTSTRLEIMQQVAKNLINSINGVNIGIMRFNRSDGGAVIHAVSSVETSRSSLSASLDDLAADGDTPLSESLYEAYRYFAGQPVLYGTGQETESVAESRLPPPDDDIYRSPIDLTCQRNHIVLLTDGVPVDDTAATSSIQNLVDVEGNTFRDLVGGTCDVETYPPGESPGGGQCLDDLAAFMHEADMSPLEGQQTVTTHAVGFLIDLPVLAETAARGGGEYLTATDSASLSNSLTNIVSNIVKTQASFVAPSVSINATNQTRTLNDVYVGMFRPSTTAHWPGNLKKFRLRASDSTIVDANDQPVVDPTTGEFNGNVQDLWSNSVDGAEVAAGGAANRIPSNRKVYTYLGDPRLTGLSNRVNSINLGDTELQTGGPGLPTAQQVIDFINGVDVADQDNDGDTTEPRNELGDPLHSRPVVVTYGPSNDDALVFIGTNDGMLHAFNVDDGSEAWAFLPPEFLSEQVKLLLDNTLESKLYGIDGTIRVQTIANQDGVIDANAGERALLFFGMRRGGDAYYALDITDPDGPEVLWRKDSSDLPGIGQSWSSVTPTRIAIEGASQNEYKLALVVGGGYDASQDTAAASTDTLGNSIYFLDTLSGELLWRGSNSGGDQDFSSSDWSMDYSIPADVRVLDLNGDGFGDRMYATDMGGQVWRFDISNGNPASSLVAGGVIAELGAAGLASPSLANTRRFYYAPDVAVVSTRDYNFTHIGIGSGYRAHPNSTWNHDEFYALRDYSSAGPMTQAQYDTLIPIVPSDLVDVTTTVNATVPQGSAGWRMSLDDGGWIGEKVLAEARTFDSKVFFSTYRPASGPPGCEPTFGTARQYVVNLFNASPVTNLDGSIDETTLELTDRYREYEGPPPPETVFFFPGPELDLDGDGVVDDTPTLGCVMDGNCLGETACQGLICSESGRIRYPVRTFWKQEDID